MSVSQLTCLLLLANIDLLIDIFLLGVLSCPLPGISELPLRHRLLLLLAGEIIFSSFLLSFCVRARTQSTAPRASPSPSRVSAGTGGWREGWGSEAAVFVPRRRVSFETRGLREWALFGLLVRGWIKYVPVRASKGRLGLQNKIQGVLIFATS